MGCAQSDLTVDGEELAAQRSNIDPKETADLDVYVSTLSSPVASGLVVVQELGLITGTFMRAKARQQMFNDWVMTNAVEAESARALAIGKLRTKAKKAGANAVLGLKVDIESDSYGQGTLGSTLVIAQGTACVVAVEAQPVATLADAITFATPGQCLYTGVYQQGEPVQMAVPLDA